MAREYGQFCGIARALEIVGGRWTLLIVRDLLLGPKRFSELQEGLPGIPTNILSSRLRELEESSVVRRTLVPRAASSVAYELTPYGYDIQDALGRLGMWGARSLDHPESDDFFPISSLAIGLRAAFDPDEAPEHALFELRIDGRNLNVAVEGGQLSFPPEPASKPDVTLECPPAMFAELLGGYTSFDSVVSSEQIKVSGSRRMARRFFEIFKIPSGAQSLSTGA